MLRKVLAVIAGIIIAFVVISIVQLVSSQVYPAPANIDFQNREAIAEWMQQMPMGAFAFVLLSYILGAFIGGLVTKLVDRTPGLNTAIITGAVLTLAGLANILMIPHPVWFIIVSLLIYIPMAYLGGMVVLKLSQPATV